VVRTAALGAHRPCSKWEGMSKAMSEYKRRLDHVQWRRRESKEACGSNNHPVSFSSEFECGFVVVFGPPSESTDVGGWTQWAVNVDTDRTCVKAMGVDLAHERVWVSTWQALVGFDMAGLGC